MNRLAAWGPIVSGILLMGAWIAKDILSMNAMESRAEAQRTLDAIDLLADDTPSVLAQVQGDVITLGKRIEQIHSPASYGVLAMKEANEALAHTIAISRDIRRFQRVMRLGFGDLTNDEQAVVIKLQDNQDRLFAVLDQETKAFQKEADQRNRELLKLR